MESERRQERDKTDLESFLRVKLPELMQTYGNRILWIITLILLVVLVLIYRRNQNQLQSTVLSENSSAAVELSSSLRQSAGMTFLGASPEQVTNLSAQVSAIEEAVASVTASEGTDSQKAFALLARADAYWAMTTAAPEIFSTTAPSSLRTVEQYRAEAEASYRDLLARYPNERDPAMSALFGLATLAEDKGDFDEAARRYKSIIESTIATSTHQSMAKWRLEQLDMLRKPLELAAPTSRPVDAGGATTAPTTQP
jgi:tetratricopeptide (TPR) repeat protein